MNATTAKPARRRRKPARNDTSKAADGATIAPADALAADKEPGAPRPARKSRGVRRPGEARPPEVHAPARESGAPQAAVAAPAQVPVTLIRVPLAVRWRDLDAFNHVNNSKYLSFLEEARLQWMMTLPGMGLDDHVAPVVAAAQLNYRRPIEWPAQVEVELFVERLGNTSVTVGHRILAGGDGAPVLYCDGHVVMVWIDRGTGSAAPLPTAVREECSPR